MTQSRSELLRIVVLFSGRGSNLNALINNINAGNLNAELVGVISSNSDAAGLTYARAANIPETIIDRKTIATQMAFDAQLLEAVDHLQPDLLVLAGFMHILSDQLVDKYAGKILNVHPSLLPAYRGLNTYQRALQAGDFHHGTSIHFVTRELDGGPVVLQVRIAIGPDDTEQSLAQRVQTCEHAVYSRVIKWVAQNQLKFVDGQVELDGKPLLEPVIMDEHMVLDDTCETA